MTKTMKKIIPCAAVLIAAVIAVVCVIASRPKEASADKPAPPATIPSGNYYIDGNSENDDLYIVVNGGNIKFQSDDLRAAFEDVTLRITDPSMAGNPEILKSQVDSDIEDWGGDYEYKTFRFGNTEKINVLIRWETNENGEAIATGQGFLFYPDSNTLHTWAGDFVIAE